MELAMVRVGNYLGGSLDQRRLYDRCLPSQLGLPTQEFRPPWTAALLEDVQRVYYMIVGGPKMMYRFELSLWNPVRRQLLEAQSPQEVAKRFLSDPWCLTQSVIQLRLE